MAPLDSLFRREAVPALRRLAIWTSTVAVAATAGGLLGSRFGVLLYQYISYDYIVVPDDYWSLGLRLGLVVGTVLAAAQVVGDRPTPSPLRVGVAFLLVGVVAVAFLGGTAWLFVELFEAGVLNSEAWTLPNPRRHALYLGLDTGARWGPLLGCGIGGVFLWRGR